MLHLKIYHHLGAQSIYKCKQQDCIRDFQGSEHFRQHLNRVHSNITPEFTINEMVIVPPIHDSDEVVSISEEIVNSNEIDIYKNFDNAEIGDSSRPFEEVVRDCALQFITNLLTKPNVTESLMQEIVVGATKLFSSGILSILKDEVMPNLDKCDTNQLDKIQKMFNVLENPFSKLNTEYHRLQFLETNNLFFKPKKVVVGFVGEKKVISGIERQVMVQVQAHLFCMKENLKQFFELPGVFDAAYQFTVSSSNNSNLTSFLNGSTWKNIKNNFQDKIVFPIFIYYDDAEMGNPLGSHSGVHKMGCIYYTVPALPPEYLSSLENIFPAFIFHSSDRGKNKFDNKKMFSSLIRDLIDLQENGISIVVNSMNITIYFALGLILGDNLGLNSMLGFVESFSANHYCRICRLHKNKLQHMLTESKESIRDKDNYKLDILKANVSETGIVEDSVFNSISNYHVTVNSVCDFMHDVSEGVARYDMATIISYLISNKYFSLEDLNHRVILFEYGLIDKKNSPPPISLNHLKNGSIIMSASEMLCFVRYFGLIVGELVPLKTEIWKLYIHLRKIIDLCCARVLQPECAHLLDALVSEHNRLYLHFSNSTLKPKFHTLTHYGRLLLKNGPISLTSSLRFESKHKVLKAYANAIPNRINFSHTLSHKLQLQMVHRFLTKKGLEPDLKVGSYLKISSIVELKFILPSDISPKAFSASWIKFKGITYKPGMLVIVEINLNGCVFGQIVNIFINGSTVPYLVCELFFTIGFDDHFHAYELKKYDETETNLIGYYIKDLPESSPTVIRVLGDGKLYATLRYAL